jgi:hypothetical protein
MLGNGVNMARNGLRRMSLPMRHKRLFKHHSGIYF